MFRGGELVDALEPSSESVPLAVHSVSGGLSPGSFARVARPTPECRAACWVRCGADPDANADQDTNRASRVDPDTLTDPRAAHSNANQHCDVDPDAPAHQDSNANRHAYPRPDREDGARCEPAHRSESGGSGKA
jgi:hypothetical protein